MLEVISYVLLTFFKTFLEIVSWFKPCRTECVEVFGHLVNVLEDECVVWTVFTLRSNKRHGNAVHEHSVN